jgi:GxxExxY protein
MTRSRSLREAANADSAASTRDLEMGNGGLLHGEVTGAILRAFDEVQRDLGPGFLESVYEAAMEVVLSEAGLLVERQTALHVHFRGRVIGDFRADLVVAGVVLVELKVCRVLTSSHDAQLLNYLRSSDKEVGLLLNFGPNPEFRRRVFANERKGISRQVSVGPRSGPPRHSAVKTAEHEAEPT